MNISNARFFHVRCFTSEPPGKSWLCGLQETLFPSKTAARFRTRRHGDIVNLCCSAELSHFHPLPALRFSSSNHWDHGSIANLSLVSFLAANRATNVNSLR